MQDSPVTENDETPVFAICGRPADGRGGGLALLRSSRLEAIDDIASASLRSTGERVVRGLAGGERIAVYDGHGLLAITVSSEEFEGHREESGAETALKIDGSRLLGDGGAVIADLEAPIAAVATRDDHVAVLTNPSDRPPAVALVDAASGAIADTFAVPFGVGTGLAPVTDELAEGLGIGGRVSPSRVAESRQERAFAAAGVTPSALWAAGIPLSVPDSRVEISVENPQAMEPGDRVQVPYRLRNDGAAILASTGANPVYLSARWHDPEDGAEVTDVVHFRSPFERAVPPGGVHQGTMTLGAPTRPGAYHVQVTPLQEGVRWFSDADDRSAAWVVIEVGASAEEAVGDGAPDDG